MYGLYVFCYAVAILGLVQYKRTNEGREGENGVSVDVWDP